MEGERTFDFTTPASEQYEKTVWNTGDIVTAQKLNNIENALSNLLPLFIHMNQETGALDRTWNEIYQALANRMVVLCVNQEYQRFQLLPFAAQADENIYVVGNEGQNVVFICSDPDDYPVWVSSPNDIPSSS